MNSLNSANGTKPKVIKTGKGITIKWKTHSDKENWLKHLRSSYKRKLVAKANKSKSTTKHEAGLKIEHADAGITATSMGGGP